MLSLNLILVLFIILILWYRFNRKNIITSVSKIQEIKVQIKEEAAKKEKESVYVFENIDEQALGHLNDRYYIDKLDNNNVREFPDVKHMPEYSN
jgi:hypothetical protein